MTNSNRLRVARAERRISQWRLAMRARIHPSRVWRIENGIVDATPRERRTLARLLKMPETAIWPGVAGKNPSASLSPETRCASAPAAEASK